MESKLNNKLEYTDCNLCNSNSTKKVMVINGFNIVKCKNCGLTYVNPRLNTKKLHGIYNKEYFENPAFKDGNLTLYGYDHYLADREDIRETFRTRLEIINKLCKRGKLLDIGCAYGFFLELAREHGWNARGLEISDAAYRYAKGTLKLNVTNTTLESAKIKSNSFDVATLFDVIEHLPDPKSTIKEIRRILKSKGLIAITTPDIGSLSARVLGRNWEEVKRVREHIYFFSRETLKKLLESLNFNVLRVESAGRYFSINSAIERGKIHNPVFFSLLGKISKALSLNNIRVYINPHYKMTMYARLRK